MVTFQKVLVSILITIILVMVIWIMACDKGGVKMKKVYENNVNTLEEFWKAFENEDLETLENLLSENYTQFYYPALKPKGEKYSKEKWLEAKKDLFLIVENISLDHKIILPGIDSIKHDLDGTVRMYAGFSFYLRDSIKIMGKQKISFSLYGFYDFTGNKISLSHEWFDYSFFDVKNF